MCVCLSVCVSVCVSECVRVLCNKFSCAAAQDQFENANEIGREQQNGCEIQKSKPFPINLVKNFLAWQKSNHLTSRLLIFHAEPRQRVYLRFLPETPFSPSAESKQACCRKNEEKSCFWWQRYVRKHWDLRSISPMF